MSTDYPGGSPRGEAHSTFPEDLLAHALGQLDSAFCYLLTPKTGDTFSNAPSLQTPSQPTEQPQPRAPHKALLCGIYCAERRTHALCCGGSQVFQHALILKELKRLRILHVFPEMFQT